MNHDHDPEKYRFQFQDISRPLFMSLFQQHGSCLVGSVRKRKPSGGVFKSSR